MLGGSGSRATVLFLKVNLKCIVILGRTLKIEIFKVLFWLGREGVTEKSMLCTLLIMLTILDDPLVKYPNKWYFDVRAARLITT